MKLNRKKENILIVCDTFVKTASILIFILGGVLRGERVGELTWRSNRWKLHTWEAHLDTVSTESAKQDGLKRVTPKQFIIKMAEIKEQTLTAKRKTIIYIFKGNSHKGYQLTLAETLQARRVWHAVPKVTKGKQRIFYLKATISDLKEREGVYRK